MVEGDKRADELELLDSQQVTVLVDPGGLISSSHICPSFPSYPSYPGGLISYHYHISGKTPSWQKYLELRATGALDSGTTHPIWRRCPRPKCPSDDNMVIR